MKLARRSFTSSHLYNKGKFSLEKLRDKCHVDGSITHVTVAFADQFGRLHSVQVNAEYFIENKGKTPIAYSGENPFCRDIMGSKIEAIEETEVNLQPDLLTLRQSAMRPNGAFVLADV
jgi:glutamine synthetase